MKWVIKIFGQKLMLFENIFKFISFLSCLKSRHGEVRNRFYFDLGGSLLQNPQSVSRIDDKQEKGVDHDL